MNAKTKYYWQKGSARKRKIQWNLTFDEWYNFWLSNGVDKMLDEEPMSATKLCMCRYGDSGPYEIGNIYCATNSENVRLRNKLYHKKTKQLQTPYGVFKSARDASKHIGCHYNTVLRKIKSNPTEYYYL